MIIRITSDNQISTHEFPQGGILEVNETLCSLIGTDCRLCEDVRPANLYEVLDAPNIAGHSVSMLVDEEGCYHDLELNQVGTFLYGAPIAGTILIVGEVRKYGEYCLADIPEDIFNTLYPKFKALIKLLGEV